MGASPSCGTSIATGPKQAAGPTTVTSRFTAALESTARHHSQNNPKTSQNRFPGTARWGPAPLAVPLADCQPELGRRQCYWDCYSG